MSETNSPAMPPNTGAVELKWPKIIGILSIVFSGFSFFGAVMTFFTGNMLRFQMKMNSGVYDVEPESIDAFIEKWNWHFVAGSGVGLVKGLILLIGGIMLLKLRKACRPLYLFYAAIGILYAFYTVYVALGSGMIDEQMSAMFGVAEGESLDDIPEATVGRISGIVGGVVGGVVALVLPVFLLVWFMRSRIKADIASRFS